MSQKKVIHEKKVEVDKKFIPEGSIFKGYRPFDQQELIIETVDSIIKIYVQKLQAQNVSYIIAHRIAFARKNLSVISKEITTTKIRAKNSRKN